MDVGCIFTRDKLKFGAAYRGLFRVDIRRPFQPFYFDLVMRASLMLLSVLNVYDKVVVFSHSVNYLYFL